MTNKLHIRDLTRNVHGDMYPTLCGVRVIRKQLGTWQADCDACLKASTTTVFGLELTPDMAREAYGRLPGEPKP